MSAAVATRTWWSWTAAGGSAATVPRSRPRTTRSRSRVRGVTGCVRTRCYRDGVLTDEGFPIDQVSEHLKDHLAVVWVDLCAPGVEDLQLVADELGLHRLAVEDAAVGRQRPKFDRYLEHDFLTSYLVRFDERSGQLSTGEIAAFITPSAMVTVHRDRDWPIDELMARWDNEASLTRFGVGALLHGLLDFIVQGHFDAVESLDEQIEELEDLLFGDSSRNRVLDRRTFEIRKSLVQLRRVALPMREVVNTLMRRDVGFVHEELMPYYQDVYDNVLRAAEWTESLRDLVNTILETNLTMQGNRLNIITKKVTSWAAIIAVPTAITGFYGQNLPYPGFMEVSGFAASSLLIVLLSVILYVVFKRNDWL
nr:magnesium transporter CorA family protein [Actinomycetales bacterium]